MPNCLPLYAAIQDAIDRADPADPVTDIKLVTRSGKVTAVFGATASPATDAPVLAEGPGLRWHSPDYRLVVWGEHSYRLTGREAACVRFLWGCLDAGEGPVPGRRVLAAAGLSQDNLAQVFRRRDASPSPAWNNLVVRYGRGLYGLRGWEGGGG